MNESQSAVDLDELERLAKAATPGPWKRAEARHDEPKDHGWDHHPCHDIDGQDGPVVSSWGYDADGVEASDADVDFIAAANPQTVLALIAEVRALRGAA